MNFERLPDDSRKHLRYGKTKMRQTFTVNSFFFYVSATLTICKKENDTYLI